MDYEIKQDTKHKKSLCEFSIETRIDDIDLPKGKLRFRLAGSAGTHNGLRDIVNKVGITPRLRIGIGRDSSMDLKDYVLSNVDQASKPIMQEAYIKSNDLIEKFIAGELCQDTTI